MAEEKGPHGDHMTVGELCAYLNINETTLKRRLKSGAIPAPAQVSPAGWKLWSPQQQQALLEKELNSKC